LRLTGRTAEGALSLAAAKQEPLFVVESDAGAGAVSIRAHSGRLELAFPEAWLDGREGAKGALSVVIAGLHAELGAESGAKELRLDGLSLGGAPARVVAGKEELFLLDLGQTGPRGLNLILRPTGRTDSVDVESASELHLTLGIRGSSYRFDLAPAPTTVRATAGSGGGEGTGTIAVRKGVLTIAGPRSTQPLRVPAGHALVALDKAATRKEEPDPFLSRLGSRPG
jgi:hypothetical protein